MQPHILVVDDDPTVLEVLSRQLEEYQVTVADSGEEALAQVRQNGFDLVIADVRMPGMDGVELLENVRKLRPDVVRFILTGYVDAHAEQAARCPYGAYKFKKPWGDEFLISIRRALEHLEASRTLRRRLGLVLGWLELPSDLEACAGPEEILAALGHWLENLDGVRQVSCYILRQAALECVHSSGRLADVSLYQTDDPLVRCISEGTITHKDGSRIESTRCLGNGETRGVVGLSVCDSDVETSCLVDHALAVASLALRGRTGVPPGEAAPDADRIGRLQQLATLGRLLAIVVHDISSPLSGMLSRLEMLQSDMRVQNLDTGHVKVLATQLAKMTAILERARHTAHPPSPELTEVNLCETITSTVSLVGYHYRSYGVLITIELADGDVLVQGSSPRLQQVWLNLLSNAFDAILAKAAGGGNIILRMEHHKAAGQVEVVITDNGIGMTSEVLHRVRTNPDFFTTRPDGLGLGVSESRRTITEHGGTLTYVSRPGKGTTATVQLNTL